MKTKKEYYFDNNATTQIDKRVLKSMMPFLTDNYANPSSIYHSAQKARGVIENSRQQVAKLIHADPSEIFFTSGGTESDNLAIKGIAYSLREKGNHIITSQIEHPAVLNTCKYLELSGFDISYIGVDPFGIINLEELKRSIRNDTILITIMFANNEVGAIQPIQEIGDIAKEHNICFHTDAVQAIGKIPINVKELNVDLLTMSGHKLYGPKGVGILYLKKGIPLVSLLHGGHHEKFKRAGTENVAGIVGMGKACELARLEMKERERKAIRLRNTLQQKLMNTIPHLRINGNPGKQIYNTISISIPEIQSHDILMALDLKGICASSGSACSSGIPEPSYVLKAMGVPDNYIHGTLRLSLGIYNTEREIDYLVKTLGKIVKKQKEFKSTKTLDDCE